MRSRMSMINDHSFIHLFYFVAMYTIDSSFTEIVYSSHFSDSGSDAFNDTATKLVNCLKEALQNLAGDMCISVTAIG